jgi:hypothetical protein
MGKGKEREIEQKRKKGKEGMGTERRSSRKG